MARIFAQDLRCSRPMPAIIEGADKMSNSSEITFLLHHMKRLLIEVDDELATQPERIAPGRSRRRSEFIRCAIRQALWDLEGKQTAEAYRQQPDSADDVYLDPRVWEKPMEQKLPRRRK